MRVMTRDILELGGSLGFLDELYEQFQRNAGRSIRAGAS